MRTIVPRALVLTLALAALGPAARAADPDLNGKWKFSLVGPFRESELMLVDLKDHGGKLEATVKDFPQNQFRQAPKVTEIRNDKGVVTMGVDFGVTGTFRGKAAADGSIPGVLRINENSIPCRLSSTRADKLEAAANQAPPALQSYLAVRTEKSPTVKVAKLREIVAKNPGSPSMEIVYTEILGLADKAALPEADVRKLANEWVDGTRAFDAALGAEVAAKVATVLSASKTYAPIALDLASSAEKGLPADVAVSARANVANALAAAARATGDKALLARAEGQVKTLEAALDEEYHKKVPPFKPETSLAGKDRKSDRAVLLELFTGAQCPPCVAADVAFDALIDTYKPSELITLQYHEHIPGPDPLTNADSEARFKYYPDARGTPTTVFDGKSQAGGGGGMGQARAKYDEFRAVIDENLKQPSAASLNLKVDRKGDELKIVASAQAKDAKADSLKLRLVLVEDQIRYTGGNNLRFHHHVVRGLPGGVEGKALAKGEGKTEVTVNLADLRKGLEAYLSDSAKNGRQFPKALPPIDLSKLAVVAFVQDDSDKSVLNATLTPVSEAKAATP